MQTDSFQSAIWYISSSFKCYMIDHTGVTILGIDNLSSEVGNFDNYICADMHLTDFVELCLM